MGNKEIGEIGEALAGRYLQGKGYRIIEYNHTNKAGEIDIIAKHPQGQWCFVEVKTVQAQLSQSEFTFDPIDKISPRKITRLHKTIQTYVSTHHQDLQWQLDAVVVHYSPQEKQARCRHFEHISREW